MNKWIGLAIVWCAATVPARAQELYGKVYKIHSTEILPEVNIRNMNTGKITRSDAAGRYEIVAAVGDVLIFSSAGYFTDTLSIHENDLSATRYVFLRPHIVALPDVDVDLMSKYVQDSINRQNDYAYLLQKKHPVKLMNEKREGDPPGFNFSPIGYFSKSEKRKRHLKKMIRQEDEDEYIDMKFSRTRVAQLTGLTNDSLQYFMYTYRPTYAFCRASSNRDMFLYINDKFVLYKKQGSKTAHYTSGK